MPTRAHHESIWEAVPPGLAPVDFQRRLAFLLEAVRPGDRVLDVGCGEGAFAAELAAAGARVVGVDVARVPLDRARERHPALDLRLIDGEGSWDLEDSAFDVVWAGEVIEHVADTAGWLSEVRRVLRSSGLLLLSTPAHGRLTLVHAALSGGFFAERFDPLADHLRFYSAASLTGLLEQFGFEAVEVRPVGGRPGSRRVLLARASRARF